jgi:lipopolysaccharide transport system ATP-binding protein
MSADVVIRAEGLGKKYVIAHASAQRERYTALRDVMVRRARNLVRSTMEIVRGRALVGGPTTEDFWALKDIDFEIRRGEVVGIIGRNGAGKSTLLKILSRITEPTEGRVTIKGRVASLLEVGTGFHPELTGYENIFLNGAVLGMSRTEIRRKLDEIITFAEVEKFLDTPVKRYSSGMYMRLAFAVAAHLEPEILLVDEVLAVGDAQFQRKCLGKISQAARGGRTVLFVSHNLPAVTGLCQSALWLAEGTMVAKDSAEDLVSRYLKTVSSMPKSARLARRHLGQDVRVEGVELLVNGVSTTHVQAGQSCTIRVHYRLIGASPIDSFSVAVELWTGGQQLTNLWTNSVPPMPPPAKPLPTTGFIDCTIKKWPYREQEIQVDVYTHIGHSPQDWVEGALLFDSHDGDFHGSSIITNSDQGIMFLDHSWRYGLASETTC